MLGGRVGVLEPDCYLINMAKETAHEQVPVVRSVY